MNAARWRALAIGLLFALVAAPLNALVGVYAFGAYMIWKAGPVSGEALQAAAMGGLIFGAPIGLLVGSLVVGGIVAWNSHRLSWLAAVVLLVVFAAVSGLALAKLGILEP